MLILPSSTLVKPPTVMIRPFESRLRSFSFRTNLAACQNGRPLPARRRRRSRPLPNVHPLLPRPHAAAVRARVRAGSGRRVDAGRPLHRFRASSGRTPDALAITVAVAFVRPLSTHRSATACQAPCPPHRRAPPGVQVSL